MYFLPVLVPPSGCHVAGHIISKNAAVLVQLLSINVFYVTENHLLRSARWKWGWPVGNCPDHLIYWQIWLLYKAKRR